MTLLALLLAGLAEGIGFSLLLPMLGAALGEAQASQNQDTANGLFDMGDILIQALAVVGIPSTVGALLIVIVCCILLKSDLLLMAQYSSRLNTCPYGH